MIRGIRRISAPLSVLLAIILVLLVGPLLIQYDYITHDLDNTLQAPSTAHWMGTDKFGRDVFSRVLFGGRISLWVAILSVALSLVIGVSYGLVSGYAGKYIDTLMNSIIQMFMAVPQFLLILSVIAVLGQHSIYWVVLIIAVFSWMDIARLTRNQTLSLVHKDFILAEKVVGISTWRLLFRHILPNLLGPVAVAVTLLFGNIILIESALSFLGLGIQPPTPSWGNLINDGRQVLLTGWWISLFPGLFIAATVLAVNMFGEYLQEKFFSN